VRILSADDQAYPPDGGRHFAGDAEAAFSAESEAHISGPHPAAEPGPGVVAGSPEPLSGEVELPHWRADATGEVPAVLVDLIGTSDPSPPSGEFASWQDDHSAWPEVDAAYQDEAFAALDDQLDLGLGDGAIAGRVDSTGLGHSDESEDDTEVGGLSESLSTDSSTESSLPNGRPIDIPPSSRGSRRSAREHTGEGRGRASAAVATLTGVGIGLLGLLVFKLGTVPTLALAIVAVMLACGEAYTALRRVGYRPAALPGLVAAGSLMLAGYLKGPAAVPLVAAIAIIVTMLWFLAGVVRARPVANIAATLLPFSWIGILGSFAGMVLDPTAFPHRTGLAVFVAAVLVTVGFDVGGFAVGRLLGRHQLAARLSPNKTVEGLVGSAVVSLAVAALVVPRIHPWTVSHGLALWAVVAVAAILGDLVESMVKRDLDIKDIGTLLPGHGGVLDRIDALLFVMPLTYYLARLLGM
jgi:phosphatidate cytidylyltransferase